MGTLLLLAALAAIQVSPLNKSAQPTVQVGQTIQLAAVCQDSNGATIPCPTTGWASSDLTIAQVDPTGMAAGVKPGTVTISAYSISADGQTTTIGKFTLNVTQ